MILILFVIQPHLTLIPYLSSHILLSYPYCHTPSPYTHTVLVLSYITVLSVLTHNHTLYSYHTCHLINYCLIHVMNNSLSSTTPYLEQQQPYETVVGQNEFAISMKTRRIYCRCRLDTGVTSVQGSLWKML